MDRIAERQRHLYLDAQRLVDYYQPTGLGNQTRPRYLSRVGVAIPDDIAQARFSNLFKYLSRPEWLVRAWGEIRSNPGIKTPGVDGMTKRYIDNRIGELSQSLSRQLREGRFQPSPCLRRMIPKPNGKLRPLGIPTLVDRIVQQSLKMVLEPIWESLFLDSSFGFRPGRDILRGLSRLMNHSRRRGKEGYEWVVEGNIKGCFDNIDHDILLACCQELVSDQRTLTLVQRFLQCGVIEDGSLRPTTVGTPQGGVISPLLANIYLHQLDRFIFYEFGQFLSHGGKRWNRLQGRASYAYFRYADDWVLMINGRRKDAVEAKQTLTQFLQDRLKLTLSPEKTKITHVVKGFHFVGYDISEGQLRCSGAVGLKATIPVEAARSFRNKVREITRRGSKGSLRTRLQALNRVIRGWRGFYLKAANWSKTANTLDNFVFWEVRWMFSQLYGREGKRRFRQFWFHQAGEVEGVRLERLFTKGLHDSFFAAGKWGEPSWLTGKPPVVISPPDWDIWTGYEPGARQGTQSLKWQCLNRDRFRCVRCGRVVSTSTSECHHRNGLPPGADNRTVHQLDELETLCVPCHQLTFKSGCQ